MAHLWHCEAGADVVVGADGINSMVRTSLWGEIPIREHNLHIFGGFAYPVAHFPAAPARA